jgi:heterodisulfide reductase subunit C
MTVDGCVECGTCRIIGGADRRHRMELSARRLRRAVQVRLIGEVRAERLGERHGPYLSL